MNGIMDNLDSYMSALPLRYSWENKVNKDSIIDVYESFSNRIKVSNVGKNIADLLSNLRIQLKLVRLCLILRTIYRF